MYHDWLLVSLAANKEYLNSLKDNRYPKSFDQNHKARQAFEQHVKDIKNYLDWLETEILLQELAK